MHEINIIRFGDTWRYDVAAGVARYSGGSKATYGGTGARSCRVGGVSQLHETHVQGVERVHEEKEG